VGSVLQISPDQLEGDQVFHQYGIDSIVMMHMMSKLEEVFFDIPKSLFVEHQNLNSVSHYLITYFPSECMTWVSQDLNISMKKTPSNEEIFGMSFPSLASMDSEGREGFVEWGKK
jgi:acyl carrier protein